MVSLMVFISKTYKLMYYMSLKKFYTKKKLRLIFDTRHGKTEHHDKALNILVIIALFPM